MSGYAPIGFYRSSPRVRLSQEYCIGCMKCMSVCPTGAVFQSKHDEAGVKACVVASENCVGCGRCVASCPTHSIGLYMA